MKIKTLALALAISTAMTGVANAAVSLQVSGGKLMGASGVVIGGNTYDVAFKDDTCAGVFGSCQSSFFDFKTRVDAITAAQALLDQVFIDSSSGKFDSDPSLTFGCSASICQTLVPYNAGDGGFNNAIATNTTSGDAVEVGGYAVSVDMSRQVSANFARFSLASVSAIPEPTTWTMLLVGFGLIGAATRYRRKGVKVRYA